MTDPVAYLMENDESMWLGFGPDHCAATVTPLYREKWKVGVPAGYKLVPIEPTAAMLNSCWRNNRLVALATWETMLNAAPKGETL